MAIQSNFSQLKRIDMEINFENILLIENFREKAINRGTLGIKANVPKAKADIVFKNKKINSQIRLKGDRKVHFEDKEKSSYKIELKKNNYILGVNKFSIQKPRLRNYIHEWIFHEMMNEFDIIKLKYEFIYFYINGEKQGLYVLEEGFGKELIERNGRRNGPIFSLNEDLTDLTTESMVFEIYNKKYWDRNENKIIAKIASQKLNDFFNNQRSLEDTFDVEKWASYFAVIDLTHTYHGAYAKSVKFYYNPLNGLFEPIPYDGHRLKPNYHKSNLNYDNRIFIDIINAPQNVDEEGWLWTKRFFYRNNKELNKNFYKFYLETLNEISEQKFVKAFLKKKDKDMNKINSHIYADYFLYDNVRAYGSGLYYFSKKDLIHRSKIIREKIKTLKNIQVVKNDNEEFIVRTFFNNYGNLFVKSAICNKKDISFSEDTIIPINEVANPFSDTVITVNNSNLNCTHIQFHDLLLNESFVIKIDSINSTFSFKDNKKFNSKILKESFKKDGKNYFLSSDEILVDRNLFIPNGYKVIIKPGQKIRMINNAFIISQSPWIVGGDGDEVVISGEKENFGGGILIANTNEISLFKNVVVSYLGGPKKNNFIDASLNTVTSYDGNKVNNYKENIFQTDNQLYNFLNEFIIFGSINFYESDVELENIKFERIASEDVINIFRSNFKINNIKFFENNSDSLDIDFSNGEIVKSEFHHIGNDAIDLSGSKVNIKNVFFENVGDKLISVGENSVANIFDVIGKNSYVGIVAKDGSTINVEKILMDNVTIPFSAYQKKPEYGYGKIQLSDYVLENDSNYIKWIKDEYSSINAEGVEVGIKTHEIIPIIYSKNFDVLQKYIDQQRK